MVTIGSVRLASRFGLAPMAGMTDTAFRRLVKAKGGCGLVVTEMVSSEGLVRGIDRTLDYAEYTEEERPIAIQIFGGDPTTMADAARIVESMGANIVDVNMGCPVRKVARHNAGCSLMREPAHAAKVVRAMTRSVTVPVTVKMRAGWDEHQINAPQLARMVEDAGAAAVTVHGRTAAQSYSGESDWDLIARVADSVRIPVFGSGDCVEPEQLIQRTSGSAIAGALVGRGALRNPWIFAQAADLAAADKPRIVSRAERGQFLQEYLDLLLAEGLDEPSGFRHMAPASPGAIPLELRVDRRHERWVVNKIRALGSWYTKGLDRGSHLRTAVNRAESVAELRALIDRFFFAPSESDARAVSEPEIVAG